MAGNERGSRLMRPDCRRVRIQSISIRICDRMNAQAQTVWRLISVFLVGGTRGTRLPNGYGVY